jgi:hypothetical protein
LKKEIKPTGNPKKRDCLPKLTLGQNFLGVFSKRTSLGCTPVARFGPAPLQRLHGLNRSLGLDMQAGFAQCIAGLRCVEITFSVIIFNLKKSNKR